MAAGPWRHRGWPASAGLSEDEARRRLLRHLRVCLDTCHLAVAYEEPAVALKALAQNGIQVGKVQITSGLEVMVPERGRPRAPLARQLAPFTQSPYLHQVIAREDGGCRRRFPDLWQALALIDSWPQGQWRIHYHMPLFVERHGALASTGRRDPGSATPAQGPKILPAPGDRDLYLGMAAAGAEKGSCWIRLPKNIFGCWRRWGEDRGQRSAVSVQPMRSIENRM